MTVTVEAPLHLERILLPHERHSIHSPMTALATDSLIDVNAVIEIHEIRKVVDPRPADRFSRAVARAHRLERGARAPDLRMAIHAGLGGRDVGETRSLYRGMAVAAIETESTDMVRMAERHRLFAHLRRPRLVARAVQLRKGPRQKSQNENCAENRDSRKRVRAVMKDLGHSSTYVPAVSKLF